MLYNLFISWKKLLVNERTLRDVQLHKSLRKPQFVQVIPGDMLAYNLMTKEHRQVNLLLLAEWLCKVEGRGLGGDCGL